MSEKDINEILMMEADPEGYMRSEKAQSTGIYCEAYDKHYCGEYPCGGGLYKCQKPQIKRIKALEVKVEEIEFQRNESNKALKAYYEASMLLAGERNDFENKFIKLQNSYYALEVADGCIIRQLKNRIEELEKEKG